MIVGIEQISLLVYRCSLVKIFYYTHVYSILFSIHVILNSVYIYYKPNNVSIYLKMPSHNNYVYITSITCTHQLVNEKNKIIGCHSLARLLESSNNGRLKVVPFSVPTTSGTVRAIRRKAKCCMSGLTAPDI